VPRAPVIAAIQLVTGTAVGGFGIWLVASEVMVAWDGGSLNDNYFAVGAMMSIVAGFVLHAGRTNLQPPGMTHDGRAEVQFARTPRVGRALKGRLRLVKGARAGDSFDVRLTCIRRYERNRDANDDEVIQECAYRMERTAVAERTSAGMSVSFEFDIPIDAPPSPPPFSGPGTWTWEIQMRPTRGLITFSSRFVVDMKPAPVELEAEGRAA
jgi:hypothetical protein